MNRSRVVLAFLFPLLLALCLYRLLTTPSQVSAYSTGPPPARTGAPGEGTCQFCHFSYPINDPSGDVQFDGLPDSYAVGEPIEFTVTVFQDGTEGVRKDWGFELTVLDSNDVFAGTLVATDCTNTQIITGVIDGRTRYYIEQTLDGTFFNPDGDFMASWTMRWVPPDTDVGPVTFYVAGNAGNGDHMQTGDFIFLNRQIVLGPGSNAAAYRSKKSGVRKLVRGQLLAVSDVFGSSRRVFFRSRRG